MVKHADLLRISGQHLSKIENDPKDVKNALDADNLVFQIARDNTQMDIRLKNDKEEKDRKRKVLYDKTRNRTVDELKNR